MPVPVAIIDQLPQVDRQRVIDRFMNGDSNAAIARDLGLNKQTIANYRRKVIHPALLTASKLQSLARVKPEHQALISEQSALAKQVIASNPAQQLLSRLTDRMATGLTRAEEAVQVVRGGDGEMVPVGDDLAILPSFYTAHLKGIELLGKMSGELQDKTAAPQVAIQIVIPERGVAKIEDSNSIEVGGIRIGLKR